MQGRTEKGTIAAALITAIFITSWYIAYFAHSYLPKGKTELDADPGGIRNFIIMNRSKRKYLDNLIYLMNVEKCQLFWQNLYQVEPEFTWKG